MQYIKKNKSFLDTYKTEIKPRLISLDLLLKQGEKIKPEDIATLLAVSKDELNYVLTINHISNISASNISKIMISLDSFICKIFKREIEYGCPTLYSPQAISYIYNINQADVENAFDFLDLKFVTEQQLPAIFAQIIN